MELEELTAAIEEQGAGWSAGQTPLSPYEVERSEGLLGYVPGPQEPALEEQEALARDALLSFSDEAPTYPPKHDWRSHQGASYITSVKDQNPCGSCVAFGACAAVEGMLRIEREDPSLEVDLAEAHLFFCVARSQGRRCSGDNGGWWPADALDAVRGDGVADEACYPYVGQDQDCTGLCSDWQSRATTIKAWHEITDLGVMKEWLSSRGPLVGTMTVYEDFVRYYKGGVYRYVAGPLGGGHCICIVGYDDEQQCWIGKNSWGDTGWGEGGFFRIAYGECGIDSSMYAVEGVQPPS